MSITQEQLYHKERVKISEANLLFLELVKDGMTRQELQTNIDRRPALWGKYKNWLTCLPTD